jgi:hypothetical protein
MRLRYVQAAAGFALALLAGTSGAVDYSVSGFATAGFSMTDTDDAELVRGSQPSGADDTGDVGLDSLAGIQATVHFSDRISGTAQLLLRRRFEPDFTFDVPLAFLKADVTKEFAVRVGRLALPVFMVSDFRQVGYANTWMRPPIEVYGQVPLDSVDGFDLLYNTNAGDVNLSAQGFYGKIDVEFPRSDVEIEVEEFWGVNLSASYGPVTLRAGRVESKLTLIGPPAAEGLIAAVRGAGFTALADELSPVDKPSSFTAFGANLDWDDWIVQAELTKAQTGGYPSDSKGAYALVGYRTGKVTPYVMYAKRMVDSAQTSTVIPQVGPLIPLALGVNALIAGQEQHTTSVGARWDATESVAVKFQYDYIEPKGVGLFSNVQTGFDGPVNAIGLNFDVVF